MSSEVPIWVWIVFNAFVLLMLFLDLFVFNRKEHVIKVKEALLWTGFWILISAIFAVIVYYYLGPNYALEYATGYLIEKSLSVDNLFVILMLFTYFRTPHAFQHKVLFWGILGAIFFRIVFIFLGVSLIERFSFMVYILGGFLIFTGIKMIFEKDKEIIPEKNPALRLFNKIMPVTKVYEGSKFFVRKDGVRHATPLFIVLIVIETTDIVFALDSIPAILAISQHPFIVYSSNIFAILGLRSLYFALAGIMKLFHFLHYGLSLILLFVGAKIVLSSVYHLDIRIALGVVAIILTGSVLLSIVFPQKSSVPEHDSHEHDKFPVKERKPPVDKT